MWGRVVWAAELNKHERPVIHGTLVSTAHFFLPVNEEPDCLSWTGSSSRSFSFAHNIVCFCIFCSELEIRQSGRTTGRCERESVYVGGNFGSCVWTICGSQAESSICRGRVQDPPVICCRLDQMDNCFLLSASRGKPSKCVTMSFQADTISWLVCQIYHCRTKTHNNEFTLMVKPRRLCSWVQTGSHRAARILTKFLNT